MSRIKLKSLACHRSFQHSLISFLLSYSFLDGAVNAYGASLHLQRSLMKTYVQNSKLIMTFHISLHSGSTTAAFVPDSPPPQRCQNSVQKKWLRVRTRLCCVQGCSSFFFFFFYWITLAATVLLISHFDAGDLWCPQTLKPFKGSSAESFKRSPFSLTAFAASFISFEHFSHYCAEILVGVGILRT